MKKYKKNFRAGNWPKWPKIDFENQDIVFLAYDNMCIEIKGTTIEFNSTITYKKWNFPINILFFSALVKQKKSNDYRL